METLFIEEKQTSWTQHCGAKLKGFGSSARRP